jgi:chorismate mutase/prephenate dehydratase
MSARGEGDAAALTALRGKIDAIDAEMHRLLMARGEVIDSLIKLKGTSKPGAAFRPGREADMMRRLVARHHGVLPLFTAEHIWREIITTFTRVQAPFDVAMDVSVEPECMRDLARFYFSFSVELLPTAGPIAVVAHVREANDLGLIAVRQTSEAWWRALARPGAPRIMALLPFIRAAGRPADLPAFVISPRLADPTPPDIRIFAVTAADEIVDSDRVEVLASLEASGQTEALVAAPADLDQEAVAAATGVVVEDMVEVGGISRGIAVDGVPSMLYQGVAEKDPV